VPFAMLLHQLSKLPFSGFTFKWVLLCVLIYSYCYVHFCYSEGVLTETDYTLRSYSADYTAFLLSKYSFIIKSDFVYILSTRLVVWQGAHKVQWSHHNIMFLGLQNVSCGNKNLTIFLSFFSLSFLFHHYLIFYGYEISQFPHMLHASSFAKKLLRIKILYSSN